MTPLKTSGRGPLLSVFRRATRPPYYASSKNGSASVVGALLLAAGALFLLVGCGEEDGVEEGATVTVYTAAGACDQAQRVLGSRGELVNSLQVSVVCLRPVRRGGHLDLARIGANARRATEDSSTIAYIGEIEPAATRFSETILEEAGIAQLSEMSGAQAMQEIVAALNRVEIGSGNLRESLRDELQ